MEITINEKETSKYRYSVLVSGVSLTEANKEDLSKVETMLRSALQYVKEIKKSF